ncbi:MAG: Cap15 family cyclic dinucleotide receptor domain-containing protein [Lutibacter sp.]|jgi:hypothetical protein
MEKDFFRYYHPNRLILMIIVLSTGLGFLTKYFFNFLNSFFSEPYIQFPTAASLLILIIIFIDFNGWKWPIFKYLFWHKDISGRYEGDIEYKHFKTGNIERKPCVIEIEQSASKIMVNTYFDFKFERQSEKTNSKSLVTSIVKDEYKNLSLVFTYHNLGNTVLDIQPSNGTNILNINNVAGVNYLDGNYFTDRIPQTKGKITAKFISKQLNKNF